MWGAIIGAGLGIGTQLFQNHQDRQDNKGTMREQMEYQSRENRDMAIHNKQQQIDLWNKTNYDEQRKHMEKAGLNVGMMYGMGGGGGATTNLATQSTSAPSGGNQKSNPLDIASLISMKNQLDLQRAQTENIKAQTAKTNVETEKIGGVDTEAVKTGISEAEARTAKLLQETMEMQTSMKDRMSYIQSEAKKAISEVETKANEAGVSTATKEAQIQTIKANAIGATLGNALLRKDIQMRDEQMKEINARVNKMGEDIAQGWQKLNIEEKRAKIQQFAEEIKADYPSIFNVGGKVIDDIIQGIQIITGGGDNTPKPKVE